MTRPPTAVLAADDDEAVLRVTLALLRHLGVPCLGAAGGAAAPDLYRRHRPDVGLVLLGVRMADPDGPAVLAGLRAIDPAVRCCLTTGGGHADRDPLALGAAAVLRKPFAVAQLAAALTEAGFPPPSDRGAGGAT